MNEHITFSPDHCDGRACIRVKDVLDLIAARVPEAEIPGGYPYLEAKDIAACLGCAAAEVDHAVLLAR